MGQFDQWRRVEITWQDGSVMVCRVWAGVEPVVRDSYVNPAYYELTVQQPSEPDRMGLMMIEKESVKEFAVYPIVTRDDWMLREVSRG